MKKGLLITIEGTDGSGKTTQIKLIESYLREKGYDVVLLREPGGTKIGEKIRSIILDTENREMSNITEMLLYASSRAQLVEQVIKPALLEGKTVICDRFVDSSLVYQGIGRKIGIEVVAEANRMALNGIEPDITFFFDVSPEIALKRRMAATEADRIELEKMEFHMSVYEGYKKILRLYPERIKAINGNRSIKEIFEEVKGWLDSKIN